MSGTRYMIRKVQDLCLVQLIKKSSAREFSAVFRTCKQYETFEATRVFFLV